MLTKNQKFSMSYNAKFWVRTVLLNKRHRCAPVGSGFAETAGRGKTKIGDPETIKNGGKLLMLNSKTSPDCQQMPETENFGAKRLKHFVGQDSWTLFELLLGKEPAFLTMRVQRLSTEETYLSLKKVVCAHEGG